ncbi:hypothetical protein ACVR0S_05475 [Streptococcus dentapri]|uniref:Uncharacterized protein n=1 Tax=Streptococcus dentapri TaxID=573564 RepID=A0ABV8CZF4_9STRE
MTKEEWMIEFQVINGRKPSEAEIDQAAQHGFQPQVKIKKSFPVQLTRRLFLKAGILIVLALLGYILGYLVI